MLLASFSSQPISTTDDVDYNSYKTRVKFRKQLAEAYKKGFEDATAGNKFDEKFTVTDDTASDLSDRNKIHVEDPVTGVDEDVGTYSQYRDQKDYFLLDRIIPIVLVGKMIYDLGGGRNWDPNLAFSNFQQEPLWKRALIAFDVARIFF